jgi:hypothetical protein
MGFRFPLFPLVGAGSLGSASSLGSARSLGSASRTSQGIGINRDLRNASMKPKPTTTDNGISLPTISLGGISIDPNTLVPRLGKCW